VVKVKRSSTHSSTLVAPKLNATIAASRRWKGRRSGIVILAENVCRGNKQHVVVMVMLAEEELQDITRITTQGAKKALLGHWNMAAVHVCVLGEEDRSYIQPMACSKDSINLAAIVVDINIPLISPGIRYRSVKKYN